MIYHILATPLSAYHSVFAVVFLFFFCVYGLAAVVSMLVRRENASLLGVVVCLFAAVFNGFGPSLHDAHKWVWHLYCSYPLFPFSLYVIGFAVIRYFSVFLYRKGFAIGSHVFFLSFSLQLSL
jgi:hypothetical protein